MRTSETVNVISFHMLRGQARAGKRRSGCTNLEGRVFYDTVYMEIKCPEKILQEKETLTLPHFKTTRCGVKNVDDETEETHNATHL